MSEYIITIEQIRDLVAQSAVEAIDGYKSGVVKQIWQYPLLPKIVRCRDCVNFKTDELGDYCTLFDFEDIKGMADKFCAWGERREP